LTDANGVLREWYRYDLQGAPMFYDANNNQLSASAFGVRHLFTGQQWYPELGLYDLRNRFYSPDLGRFLQPDPVGFSGDASNLYRYCGNNPVVFTDPSGEILPAVAAILWAGAQGAAIGGGLDLIAQLADNGWDLNKVNRSEVLIQMAAGALTGGSSAFYAKAIQGVVRQVAANVLTNVVIGSASQVGINASNGNSLDKGVATQAFYSAIAGGVSGLLPSFSGKVAAALEATAIGLENWPQLSSLFRSLLSIGSASYQAADGRIVVVGTDPNISLSHDTSWGPTWPNGTPLFGDGGVNPRVPADVGGVYYPFGFGNISPSMNFAGGRAGTMLGAFSWGVSFGGPIQGSIFGPDNWYAGLDPMAAVGSTGSGPKPTGIP
jgi:RHS repeat-associated protein